MHHACIDNNLDKVQKLVDCKVSVNAKTSDDETSLHLAVKNKNEPIVKILLEKEADPNIADYTG